MTTTATTAVVEPATGSARCPHCGAPFQTPGLLGAHFAERHPRTREAWRWNARLKLARRRRLP